MKYIWQDKEWPHFLYDTGVVQEDLYMYAKLTSAIAESLQHTEQENQQETQLDIIVSEAIRSSEIEGEFYTRDDIRSSLKNWLGLSEKTEKVRNERANGIAHLMLMSRETFREKVTKEMLFDWHHALMQFSPQRDKINIGKWRDSHDPMQIISGPFGREKVHYEAPESIVVPQEMDAFINWFNQTEPTPDKIVFPGPVRAAITHLYFELIHPFDDGNGRIGRTLAEKALAQDLGRPILLSLSTEIFNNKKAYYDELSRASKGSLDITPWIKYFCKLCLDAQISTRDMIDFVVFKSKYLQKHASSFNPRQYKVVKRILKEGPKGFIGGMTSKKYMKMTDASKATATRDLADLLKKGCLIKQSGEGRSTSYAIPYNIRDLVI